MQTAGRAFCEFFKLTLQRVFTLPSKAGAHTGSDLWVIRVLLPEEVGT